MRDDDPEVRRIIKSVDASLTALFTTAWKYREAGVADLLAKAEATTDPELRKGYEKLARKAARKVETNG